MSYVVIPTRECDRQACLDFLASDTIAYEHLDWLGPQERLFDPLSFALLEENSIKAILCLSADVPRKSWICFFNSLRDGLHPDHLRHIYAHLQPVLKSHAIDSVFLLDLRPWMTLLAEALGFRHHDDVISFSYSPIHAQASMLPHGYSIRSIQPTDLPAVLALDQLCFLAQWQMSTRSLEKLLQNGGLHSVLLYQERLIAYAMHSTYGAFAHLDRIAVLPSDQGQGCAKALLINQIQSLQKNGVLKFTVNTQASNLPSQRLYQAVGYIANGIPVPVLSQSIG